MSCEQWDLTPKVSPYLDRHLLFPLLDFTDELIASKKVAYSSKDVAEARLSLLSPTHMVDYAIEMYKGLHGENAPVPDEMMQQKQHVTQEREELRKSCEVLDKLFGDKERRVS